MNIIFKEILYQKLKSKPNRKFIRRLQTYVDSTDEMTLEDFQSFGRFIPRERFMSDIYNDYWNKRNYLTSND